jgi:hypothetical protein
MTLSATKLRAIVNLLSDPGSAANAAGILAREAKERGVLVADLVAQSVGPAPSPAPAPAPPSGPPSWRDVGDEEDEGGPYTKYIGPDHVGLVSEILAETDKAWLVEKPDCSEAWLAKSVVEHHGEGHQGRVILVLPRWLCRKIGLAA